MQWWIEQTNRRWQTLQSLEDACEVFSLIRQKLRKSLLSVVQVVGKNHFSNGVDAIAFEEHVLGSCQTDP